MKRLLFLATILLTLTAWGPFATAQPSPATPHLVRTARRHHAHHKHHRHGHRSHHV
jgi:hypothetical protein